MTIVRRRIDREAAMLLALFEETDEDHDCFLEVRELGLVLATIGFSFIRMADVEEAIDAALPGRKQSDHTLVHRDKSGLRYEEALAVVESVRSRQGFSQDELEMIMDTYANADVANQGELELEAWGIGEREAHGSGRPSSLWTDEDGCLIGQEVQDALDFRGEVPEVSTSKIRPKSLSGPLKGYSWVDLLGLLALAQELEMRRARQLEHCDCPVLVGSGCKTTPAS